MYWCVCLLGTSARDKGEENEILKLWNSRHGCESREKWVLSRWGRPVLFSMLVCCMRKVLTPVGLDQTGEGLKVMAHIANNSSREIKPKYTLYRKHSFFANDTRNVSTKDLIKEVGDPIPPCTSQNVARVINIPQDAEPSIFNCSIIKAEYRLRVGQLIRTCLKSINSVVLLTNKCPFFNFVHRSTWMSNTHLTQRLNFP